MSEENIIQIQNDLRDLRLELAALKDEVYASHDDINTLREELTALKARLFHPSEN